MTRPRLRMKKSESEGRGWVKDVDAIKTLTDNCHSISVQDLLYIPGDPTKSTTFLDVNILDP